MIRGDLIRHVGLKLGLDQTISSDERLLMEDWSSEGVRDVLLETHCKITPVTPLPLTVGIGDYSIVGLLQIENVQLTMAGETRYLIRRSFQEIMDMRLGSTISDFPRYFAVEGDVFLIFPNPSSAASVTIYGIPIPTAFEAGTTGDARDLTLTAYGGLPVYAHRGVEYFMLWQGAEYDEKRAPHTPADYRKMYNDELGRIRKMSRKMGGRVITASRIGYPGRDTGFSRNDTYPER